MGPNGLPESFNRRRSRAGSDDNAAIGELSSSICPPAALLEGKCPSSPKWLRSSKSQDSLYPFTNGITDRACSRDTLVSSDGECEAELTDTHSAERQSLFRDLCQTQLSLWTFTVSTLLTYFWQKRVNLRSVLFAGCAVVVTVFMAGLLATVVTMAHLFNSDFAESFGGFSEWINEDDTKSNLIRRQSSSFRKSSRRSSGGSGGSGATTPRSADKFQQTRLWQKNVATLERSYIGSSRS